MAGHEWLILSLALILGFYLAWNIGANDVANAMGTSVGSGSLNLKNALFVAALLEFCGAFFVGAHVSQTIETGLLNESVFAFSPQIMVYGMLASLLATGVWLQIASYFGWPVSTTHGIIGAVVGFGFVLGGPSAIEWDSLSLIASSWILSPIMGGILSFVIFTILRRRIFYTSNPLAATKQLVPPLVFAIFTILSAITLFKGLTNVNLDLSVSASMGISVSIGLVAATISYILLRWIKIFRQPQTAEGLQDLQVHLSLNRAVRHLQRVQENASGELKEEVGSLLERAEKLADSLGRVQLPFDSPEYATIERIFIPLQIISACAMAFSHGANDVANAIGPLASIFSTIKAQEVVLSSYIPTWALALGGLGIVVGLATWGWRVIETIGKKLTELTPSRGFAAEFGAATTILLASKLGLPISTTHTLVGSVLGVGLARGIGALNLGLIRDIFLSWLVTIPTCAFLAVIFYYGFILIFGTSI